MGQINHPTSLVDQVAALRKEVEELRKRLGIVGQTPVPISFDALRAEAVMAEEFATVWDARFNRARPNFVLHTVDGADQGTAGTAEIVVTDVTTGDSAVVDSWEVRGETVRTQRGPYPLPLGPNLRAAVRYRRTSGRGSLHAEIGGAAQVV
jgi:hypothetical protein